MDLGKSLREMKGTRMEAHNRHLTIRVGDQHGLGLMDGNPGPDRPTLNAMLVFLSDACEFSDTAQCCVQVARSSRLPSSRSDELAHARQFQIASNSQNWSAIWSAVYDQLLFRGRCSCSSIFATVKVAVPSWNP